MKAEILPNNVLKLMSPADRRLLGRAGLTTAEVEHIVLERTEKQLQEDMIKLLDQRGIFFNRSRMDKRTTCRVGMFDFTIFLPNEKYLAVEAKVAGGALSLFQRKVFTEFWEKTGRVVHIVMDLDSFRKLLDEHVT